jgi:hypothetical protein
MAIFDNFEWQDVEAQGKKPWTAQRKFAEEIDTDSMAETAAAYARASAETKDVDDLASRATEVSQGAGSLNGASLVKNGRYDETHRALQRGGDDMDTVVSLIIRGMNRALDAEQHNEQHIQRMNGQLRTHQANAQAEWGGWERALSNANLNVGSADDPHVTVTHNGRRLMVPRQGLPQWLADEIREKHLKLAVADAGRAEKDVRDEINYYRHRMMNDARELAELGYRLTEGPFELYMTQEMAQYAARMLKKELERKNPNPELLEGYTAGLRAIAEGIYGEPPTGGSERDLSPAERAYLLAFYNTLDAESLAKLGDMNGLAPVTNTKRNVANGIMMLMNREIGGLGPSGGQPMAGSEIPESIRHFVYDYRDTWKGDAFSPEFLESVERFNGFGGLMEEATVASGTDFSRSLAHAAVFAQSQLQGDPNVSNTGASGMLMAAALNTDASALLLSDDQFNQQLLGLRWDDSRGVANLVEGGTIVPEGMNRNSPEAQKYFDAAENVLTYAARHPDDIRGTLIGGGTMTTHDDLQRAIGQTALKHMDLMSRPAGDTGLWKPEEHHTINGTRYEHGFDFGNKDLQSLFSLMNSTPSDVRDGFFTDVAGWEYRTAYHAFREGGNNIGPTIENIGNIAGAAAQGQSAADTDGLQGKMAAAGGAKNVFDFVGTLPGNVTGPATWPFKVGAEALEGHYQEQINAAELNEITQIQKWDRLPARLLIADAARAAGASDIGEPPDGRPGSPSNPNNWANLNAYTNGILGPNDFNDDFETGFRIGSGQAPNPDAPIPESP